MAFTSNWYQYDSNNKNKKTGSTTGTNTNTSSWLGSWFSGKNNNISNGLSSLFGGGTTATTTTPTTTQTYTQQAATPLTTQQVSDYYRSMPSYVPSYTQKTADELKRQAQIDVALQYDPQVSSLQRAYELQNQDYQNQINTTKSNYADVESSVQAAMQAAEKRALDQAIAMGGGMSGMSTWLTNEAYKTILPQLTQAKMKQATELQNIGNNLSLALRQYNQETKDLAAQRANAELARITELQETDYAKALDNYQLMQSTLKSLYETDWDQEKFRIENELKKQGMAASSASAAADQAIQQQKLNLQKQIADSEAAMALADRTGYINGAATMAREQQAFDQAATIAELTGYLPLQAGVTQV